MQDKEGMIFDIQGYSVHDGPGCRTLVFLSGCPLRCRWCANPEGWEKQQQLMFRISKCVHIERDCNRCQKACPYEAINFDKDSKLTLNRYLCKNCNTFDCVSACHNEALVLSGKIIKSSELMRIINRDRQYWGKGGGVSFTGGEPLFQKDFIKDILRRCREDYIHTAIETTGYIDTNRFLEIINYVDWAFIDLKHMNPTKHMEQTGVSNDLILKNIKTLAGSDWPGMMMIRIPIIEGFNDDDENIEATSKFLLSAGLEEVNILPFHRLGESKWQQLGMPYSYAEQKSPSDEVMGRIRGIFLAHNIHCFVGSDTPF